MKLSRGARHDNLYNSCFFRCPSALALICMKLFNVCADKISPSLSLSPHKPHFSSAAKIIFNLCNHVSINVVSMKDLDTLISLAYPFKIQWIYFQILVCTRSKFYRES